MNFLVHLYLITCISMRTIPRKKFYESKTMNIKIFERHSQTDLQKDYASLRMEFPNCSSTLDVINWFSLYDLINEKCCLTCLIFTDLSTSKMKYLLILSINHLFFCELFHILCPFHYWPIGIFID